MAEIQHKLSINAPKATVYRALATINGLASWWTSTTGGTSEVGKNIEFRFNEHRLQVRVDVLDENRSVAWTCLDHRSEWTGTRIKFDLAEEDGRTVLRFAHRDWKEQSDFLSHCSMKWATFLLSLREVAESGKGRPFPYDLPV